MRALLGLEQRELGPVLSLGGVHALLGAAVAAGDVGVQAVFISRMGSDDLPSVLLARGVASPIVALLYGKLAEARSPRRVLCALGLIAAAASASYPWLIEQGEAGITAAYVGHEILAGLLTVHWGVYLLSYLRRGAARRGVALVYASARGGAALLGAAAVPLVAATSTPILLYVAAALFGLTALLGLLPQRGVRAAPDGERRASDSLAPDPEEEPHAPQARGLRALLSGSALLPMLALGTLALVMTRFTLRFQQQSLLSGLDEEHLASLLGLYMVGGNVVGVLLQLLVVGRLLDRFGVARANLVYPVAVIVGQAVLFMTSGIGAALLARFIDGELKHSMKTPVSPLLYEAFAADDRGPARAFVLGVVSPISQVLVSLALKALVDAGAGGSIAVLGAAGGILYLLATVIQNRGYERTIHRDSLRGRDA